MKNILKKTVTLSSLLLFLFLIFTGCSSESGYQKKQMQWLEPSTALPVLCTTEMIEALVSRIGGNYVKTLPLVYGELDPHSYQMVKGDKQKFDHAHIVFCNGLELEHGPSLKSALANHSDVVFLADLLKKTDFSRFIYHGSIPDPHIWLDVALFSQLCPLIAQELSRKDPAHSSYYNEEAIKLRSEMLALHEDLYQRFQSISSQKRYLVTSHEAFYYFARAYLKDKEEDEKSWKNRFCAPEGLAPESQISLHRLMEIVSYIQNKQIHTVFLEVNVSSDAVYKIQEILSKKKYLLEVFSDPLFSDCMPSMSDEHQGDPTARYFHMIRSNADIILKQWGVHELE